MKNTTYHFGFGVDANYVKYAGVLMTNILLTHLGRPVCFHLICDGIHAEDEQRLAEFARLYANVRVHVHNATPILDELRPISPLAPPRLHRAALLRNLLPSFVEDTVERVVYMDVDMLCLKPLDELWQVQLSNRAVAAVLDVLSARRAKAINLTQPRYLSNGLMVLNLPVWRAQNLQQRILDYYQEHAHLLKLPDQDAINAVLDGKFVEINEKFSHLVEVNNPMLSKIQDNTVALHFVNEAKAWTKGCIPEIHSLYWSYVQRSLWYDMQMVEPTTIKAAFLAATTYEMQGDYQQATQYYAAVARRLTEYYLEQNRAELFEENM